MDSPEQESQAIRRKDLVDLGQTFITALSPLTEVVSHMEDATDRYAENSKETKQVTSWLRRVTYLLITVLVFQVVFTIVLFNGVVMQQEINAQQSLIDASLRETLQNLTILNRSAHQVEQTMKKAEDERMSRSSVELVPELDPVKAARVPLKIRINPPEAAGAVPTTPVPTSTQTIEIPINADKL